MIKNNKKIASEYKFKIRSDKISNYKIDDNSVYITTGYRAGIPLGYGEFGFAEQLKSALLKAEMI